MNRVEYILSGLNGKILDVGYYACTLHQKILEKAGKNNVYGIDTETKKETKFYKKASAEKIPFKNSEFDTILAGELIEHLKAPEKFIKESNRILKKGGKIIITTPNRDSLVNRIFHNNYAPLHFSLFNFKELKELLKNNGFEITDYSAMSYTIESSEGSHNSWSFGPRIAISYFLPKSLREELVITARKIK